MLFKKTVVLRTEAGVAPDAERTAVMFLNT